MKPLKPGKYMATLDHIEVTSGTDATLVYRIHGSDHLLYAPSTVRSTSDPAPNTKESRLLEGRTEWARTVALQILEAKYPLKVAAEYVIAVEDDEGRSYWITHFVTYDSLDVPHFNRLGLIDDVELYCSTLLENELLTPDGGGDG